MDHKVVDVESNFLQKPFTLKQLASKVRTVLDHRPQGRSRWLIRRWKSPPLRRHPSQFAILQRGSGLRARSRCGRQDSRSRLLPQSNPGAGISQTILQRLDGPARSPGLQTCATAKRRTSVTASAAPGPDSALARNHCQQRPQKSKGENQAEIAAGVAHPERHAPSAVDARKNPAGDKAEEKSQPQHRKDSPSSPRPAMRFPSS